MHQNGPTIALPDDIARERDQRAKQERAGRQILDSLACAIYVQLAVTTIGKTVPGEQREQLLQYDAAQAVESAFPMAAQLGWHFQQRPDDH